MKLVRDKIPILFPDAGTYYKADWPHIDRLLMAKAVEELAEVFGAGSAKELTREIADVIEVLYAFAGHVDVSPEDIDRARIAKRLERGGFSGRWVLDAD